ncbi:MAG: mannosyl-glycoprotein endo-beta-N-acetylglucosamidase [Alphaproteobacteria bacterium]|nr:mannosyl-glycoprotein endo-beta-N-acetylglucosamidase [Alphaproteobacteria bacterium]
MRWQTTIAAMTAAALLAACGEIPVGGPGRAADGPADCRETAFARPVALPAELARLTVEDRKTVFVNTVLPAIRAANGEVMCERATLQAALRSGNDAAARAVLAGFAERYGSDDPAVLLWRVAPVPTGLALAQAAMESGWGTSRFAREGNALFGMQNRGGAGLKARDSDATVFAYDDLHASARHYARTLNTHPAYREFRLRRAASRGEAADSCALAQTLTRYSARGEAYGRELCALIRANDFDEADL